MTKQPLTHLVILLISLPILVISQSDQSILLNIKKQWHDQPPLQSWDSTIPHCQWQGIECDTNNISVSTISLNSQNIYGEIPPFICQLEQLTTLDLGNNYISGVFPTFLYDCRNLQVLNLSSNLFVGSLPNDINKLSIKLEHLDLGYNNFTDDIPSSIGDLTNLISLNLTQNLFNGTFPRELGNLENLVEFQMIGNGFTPMKLPMEFGKLSKLKILWLKECNLIGEIPKSFANLLSLEHLDLVGNSLVGEIPSGIFLLKSLKYLYLYRNQLSGELPSLFKAVNLRGFDVSMNNLSGKLPIEIENCRTLEVLNLFQNQFSGSLPSNIAKIPTLKTLKIFINNFSGTLPSELGLHSNLEVFEVSDNGFIGQLPENLCSGNSLLGMVAFNNYLNGSIPSSLSQCKSLLTIQVNNNSMSGEVPQGLWTLVNMAWIMLQKNQFTGPLPERLGPNVTRVLIGNNRFSGTIPLKVATWQSLLVFDASNNLIKSTIPLELTSLSRLQTLSLDGNQLYGQLPSEFVSWQKLTTLNLSRNELSGSIPGSLGSLPVLKFLDLSNNHFNGQIPPQLDQLALSSLNLSSNNLNGGIPYGFDNDAFKNSFFNTRLCCKGGISTLPKCSIYKLNSQTLSSKYLALILVLAFVAFLATSYFSWFIVNELRQKKHVKSLATWKLTSFHKVDFTEEKILANLSESNVIGSGGSGKVYRISIDRLGKDIVAVKRIWNKKKINDALEKAFLAEVDILGTIRHLNIVKLLCCISSEDSKLLVYEYLENQSLDQWIHKCKRNSGSSSNGSIDRVFLVWPARLKIAIGAAQGLCYMHNYCSPPIIHRDVKSSNILLDSEFNAKIADFGLAKILAKSGGEPHTVSAVVGSFGYMAPEYCITSKVNEKIDIYSFGVVLLELVTGKEPHTGDEYSNLAEWSWKHYIEEHPIVDVLDEEVIEDCYMDEMINVFKIGLMCTSSSPSARPSMERVLEMLRRCNVLEGCGRNKDGNDPDFAPLLGSKDYVSSCKNSRRTIEEDVFSLV